LLLVFGASRGVAGGVVNGLKESGEVKSES
jgi:hypothetical protein